MPFNIDWYRDTQTAPIMNSQRIGVQGDGTLEIQAVRAADVGTYSCMVKYWFSLILKKAILSKLVTGNFSGRQ